ncbi:MAG: hypothetical protein L0216_02735, partial [Planctomycetales bacterium]|nr:hypothetical protein [Planctomycetales bacterium]
MPIYPRTYRPWSGPLRGAAGRTMAIARAGFGVAWRSRWLRRFLLFAWAPAVYFAALFWIASQLTEPVPPWYAEGLGRFLGEGALRALREDPSARSAL